MTIDEQLEFLRKGAVEIIRTHTAGLGGVVMNLGAEKGDALELDEVHDRQITVDDLLEFDVFLAPFGSIGLAAVTNGPSGLCFNEMPGFSPDHSTVPGKLTASAILSSRKFPVM